MINQHEFEAVAGKVEGYFKELICIFNKNASSILLVFVLLFLVFKKDITISINLKGQGAALCQGVNKKKQDVERAVLAKSADSEKEEKPVAVKSKKRMKMEKYVQDYKDLAITEMKKYNIPASIKLAQGLLESQAGESKLAKQCNNHFGIKCFSKQCSKNHCKNFTDDSHKDFFRNYTNPWSSYRAHSTFLTKSRYNHLLELPVTDYKAWAHGLKKSGYATDPKYAEKIINIVEKFELHKYDEF